jgi:N4-gp56 family major capsid protein
VTDVRYTGMQATVAPGTSSQIWSEAGTTSDADLDSTGDTMTLAVIDAAVVLAKTRTLPLRPAKIRGRKCFAFIMHPYQVRDLKQASSGQTWMDIQRSLVEGGFLGEKDSPIFKGGSMVGYYNGCLLLESNRITTGAVTTTADTDTRRAVLLGAQAAAFAYGQKQGATEMSWVEELFDYENQLGVSAGMIAGLNKLTFNGYDHGVIVASTYAAA